MACTGKLSGAGSPPDAITTSLDIDRSGLLWIGTHERGLAKVDPEGTAFLHVAEGDVGKVIGRQGRIARALRTLVRAGGPNAGRRLQLDIVG